MAVEQLDHLEIRDRLSRRRRVQRHTLRVPAVPADRRLDAPPPRTRPSTDEREILPFDLAAAQEALQAPMSLVGARDDEEPGGVPIQAVHDSRPLGLLPALDLPAEEAVDERAASMPRRWMHDQAGGLVDDEKMLVLVRDAKRHLLGLQVGSAPGGYLDLELLSSGEPMALRARSPVDENPALAEEPRRHGSRADLLEPGEETVEALAGRLGRHGDRQLNQESWARGGSSASAGCAAGARRR